MNAAREKLAPPGGRTSRPGRPRAKRYRGSADWSDAFLAHLRRSANVRASCSAARIARATAYDRRASDEAFARRWADALADAVDDLEQVAFERARAESDTLAIFLLKSHRRNVYGDKVEAAGTNRLVVDEEAVEADRADPPGAV